VIIVSYAAMTEDEADTHLPTVLHFDEDNNITRIARGVPVQPA
jgi:aspartate 1-decarboxylase